MSSGKRSPRPRSDDFEKVTYTKLDVTRDSENEGATANGNSISNCYIHIQLSYI